MAGMELFGPEERKEVSEVLETGILFRYGFDQERRGHWKAREFEAEIAGFTGAKHCLACSSGSAAVSIMLAAAGVGAGDEVIVPPYTFIATIEAVLLAGAIPVFAEIDDTLNLSPEGIEAVITEKTKAVCLVHMCGSMARMDEIIEICNRHNILLLEDTAQSLGAFYKGRHLGLFGKAGSFSFDFFKTITAGEGGAVITNDKDVAEKMPWISDHGHNHVGGNRGAERHPILGFNFRIGELNAAVGLAQARKLPQILKAQKENKKRIKSAVARFAPITFRHLPDPDGDAATFLNFFLPDHRTTVRVVEEFNNAGVFGMQYWYDNNYHYIRNWQHLKDFSVAARLPVQVIDPGRSYRDVQLPRSDDFLSRLISLIIKVSWTEDQLADHIKKITGALDRVLS
jgi:8-amino-3,8-dideoxy-alpha-D-manno-octulosonate transaminase